MRTFLRRLILVLIIAIIATILWDQKDRIALLNNNNFRMEGDWYRVEMNFKGSDVYNFSERLITRNGMVCGSYELRSNTGLEVTLDDHRRFRVGGDGDPDTTISACWSKRMTTEY